MRRRQDIDGQFVSIEHGFLFGDDYRVIDFSNVELLCYLRLWGDAAKFRRHLLPGRFNVNNPQVLARLTGVSSDVCQKAIRKASENGLIRVFPEGGILVVGVGDKHWWSPFKDDGTGTEAGPDPGTAEKRKGKSSTERRNGQEAACPSASPTPPSPQNDLERPDNNVAADLATPSEPDSSVGHGGLATGDFCTDFPEIYATLAAIDARGYRSLCPYAEFDRDLSVEVERLGRERVLREAEQMRTWIESRFRDGGLKREARHRPQDRFLRWLRRCKPGDDDHGRSDTNTPRCRSLVYQDAIATGAIKSAQRN